MGDIIGAAVEAESAGYIKRKPSRQWTTFWRWRRNPESFSGSWEVGRFTDDTQMTLGVAEWLLSDSTFNGRNLLGTVHRSYEPWRHYGPGTRLILESFPTAKDK